MVLVGLGVAVEESWEMHYEDILVMLERESNNNREGLFIGRRELSCKIALHKIRRKSRIEINRDFTVFLDKNDLQDKAQLGKMRQRQRDLVPIFVVLCRPIDLPSMLSMLLSLPNAV